MCEAQDARHHSHQSQNDGDGQRPLGVIRRVVALLTDRAVVIAVTQLRDAPPAVNSVESVVDIGAHGVGAPPAGLADGVRVLRAAGHAEEQEDQGHRRRHQAHAA